MQRIMADVAKLKTSGYSRPECAGILKEEKKAPLVTALPFSKARDEVSR